MSEEKSVCQFFRVGYCKFKSMCKLKHVEEECKIENCSSESCEKRHRKPCFYWKKFGNCKIGNKCAYKHEKRADIVDLENKIEGLLGKISEKDTIIGKLVEDVKNLTAEVKKLKDTASQANLVREEKKASLEEKQERVPKDDATVEIKAKEFINKNLKHLENMKKEVKKCRKNGKDVREKIMTVYRKMKDEVRNCDLDPKSSVRHFNCSFTVDEFENQIQNVEANDRDESLMVIEEFITEFEQELMNEV